LVDDYREALGLPKDVTKKSIKFPRINLPQKKNPEHQVEHVKDWLELVNLWTFGSEVAPAPEELIRPSSLKLKLMPRLRRRDEPSDQGTTITKVQALKFRDFVLLQALCSRLRSAIAKDLRSRFVPD
jgi:hypothetical protein